MNIRSGADALTVRTVVLVVTGAVATAVTVVLVVEAGVRREEKPLVMWDTGWFYGG